MISIMAMAGVRMSSSSSSNPSRVSLAWRLALVRPLSLVTNLTLIPACLSLQQHKYVKPPLTLCVFKPEDCLGTARYCDTITLGGAL